MKSNRTILLTTLIMSCLLAPTISHASLPVYTVPATANIFSAGLSAPVAPGGGGAGTLPVLISISQSQGNAFQFQAWGTISQFPGFYFGPDGLPNYADNINAYGGISGFRTDQLLPLVGVFLSDSTPQAPAPPTLNFGESGLGLNFLTLSPAIGQVFFIGDGQTGGGLPQTFYAPAGATGLYLGFPDSPTGAGNPGGYADNSGSLTVTVSAVPEPELSTLGMFSTVLIMVLRCRKATVVKVN